MRIPNPPKIMLQGLTEDQQRKVIKLALSVVVALAEGNEWSALEQVEFAKLDLEESLAFGSLLDSRQAATIVSMREAAK